MLPKNSLYLILAALILCNTAQAAEHKIKMLDKGEEGVMVFEPSVLEVALGDTVTFIPADPTHDSISVLTPEGANSWHGKREQEITIMIDKEGIYIYKCAPHYYHGMFGVIHTGELVNLKEAKAVAQEHSAKFLMNEDRLVGYIDGLTSP